MNKREQRFCDEYLIDTDAIQAALRAGYAPSTARMASVWLSPTNKKYRPELAKHINQRMEEMHNKNVADAQEVVEYLTAVMRGQTRDQIPIMIGEGKQEIIEVVASTKERLRAAELLGKRYSLFSDRIGVEGAVPVVISGGDALE